MSGDSIERDIANDHHYVTYGETSVWLEDGFYTIPYLREVLHHLEELDTKSKKALKSSMEKVTDES